MKNANLQIISPEFLSQRIEQIIQEHLDACRKVAQETVARTFQLAAEPRSKPVAPMQHQSRRAVTPSSTRRTAEELRGLCEHLYQTVCHSPGETMATLASQLGLAAVALQRPVALLKAEGKVRCVGQRNLTRYFPTGTEGMRGA